MLHIKSHKSSGIFEKVLRIFLSTRGGVGINIPFSKVVIDGYADDGGLYVPNSHPTFDLDTLRKCSAYSDLGQVSVNL